MARNVLQFIWETLSDEIEAQDARIAEVALQADVAGTAYAFPTSQVADLPLAADGQVTFSVAWAADGRKGGESAGNGTGVPCYYNPATDAWLTFSDNSQVQA